MDVTVRGGGVFGLAIAFACARRGARVRLIERRGIAAGASGGPVGALAPHVPENWNPKKAFQHDSLVMAPAFWAAVSGISGLPTGYARTGRVQPLADAQAVATARARSEGAALYWQGAAQWQVVRGDDWLPAGGSGWLPAGGSGWLPAGGSGWLVHDTMTARIAPPLACAALAGALRELGAQVIIGEDDAEPKGAVVWATGAEGLAELSTALGHGIGSAVKGQALALRFAAAQRPQIFADGLHIVPHADGTVAIGSTTERIFDGAQTTDGALDGLLARAVAACPALAGAPVITRWAGLRARANTRAPILGPWPGRPGHFIANGGFKIGFGMAPKVADVMASVILDGTDAVPQGFRVTDNL